MSRTTLRAISHEYGVLLEEAGSDSVAATFSADHMRFLVEHAIRDYRQALKSSEPDITVVESALHHLELARAITRSKHGDRFHLGNIPEEDKDDLGFAFFEAFDEIMEELFIDSDPATLSEEELESFDSPKRLKKEIKIELMDLLDAYDPSLGGSKFRSGEAPIPADEIIRSELEKSSGKEAGSPKESGWKKFFKGAAKFAGELSAGYAAVKATSEAADAAYMARRRRKGPNERMLTYASWYKLSYSNVTVFGGWCPKCKCSNVWHEQKEDVHGGVVMKIPCEGCGVKLRAKAPEKLLFAEGNSCEITLA